MTEYSIRLFSDMNIKRRLGCRPAWVLYRGCREIGCRVLRYRTPLPSMSPGDLGRRASPQEAGQAHGPPGRTRWIFRRSCLVGCRAAVLAYFVIAYRYEVPGMCSLIVVLCLLCIWLSFANLWYGSYYRFRYYCTVTYLGKYRIFWRQTVNRV